MKKIILFIVMVIATSPVYALTQKQEQKKHKREHMHQLHKENKILQRWMAESEKKCDQYHKQEFHSCYINSMKDMHINSKIQFSTETEEAFEKATRSSQNTSID
jgi:Ni/Co efflux regulator RcnB